MVILVTIKTYLEMGLQKPGVNQIFQFCCMLPFQQKQLPSNLFFFSVAIHMLGKLEVLNQSILSEDAGRQGLLFMKLVIYFSK